jgi:isocitrate dehydrogenase (NAD+)
MAHEVTFIPGDGTGPELTEATRRVLEATGVALNWDRQEAGIDEYRKHGNPFPDATLESLKRTGVGIKGPTTTPVGSGFRSINVLLRKELDLYAGIEYESGTPEAEEVRQFLNTKQKKQIREGSGISIKPISAFGSERIVRHAFDYAVTHGYRKVVAGHKANIMKFSDGLFLEVAREVAADYPAIDFEDVIVDNLCNQLITYPEDFEVIVLPNLYGDIVSDLCAAMIGGLGMAGGANIGSAAAVFEATHGSAPTYAGSNRMNPTALMLSGVYMLDHLKETAAARALERAIATVIRKGEKVTYDLKPTRTDPTAVGTSEFADAVREEMNA